VLERCWIITFYFNDNVVLNGLCWNVHGRVRTVIESITVGASGLRLAVLERFEWRAIKL
jgi:phage tail protein X